MLASNFELLRHILDEVDFVLITTANKQKDDVVNDGILSRAIIRSLEIGEAATKLDIEFKSRYPHVEWKKMAGTRNRLIHDYFGVDYDIVWSIIQTKLPDLRDAVAAILDEAN